MKTRTEVSRSSARPLIRAGAALVGAAVGAPAGPVGSVALAGIFDAAARDLTEADPSLDGFVREVAGVGKVFGEALHAQLDLLGRVGVGLAESAVLAAKSAGQASLGWVATQPGSDS